jgi:hypothetical protein
MKLSSVLKKLARFKDIKDSKAQWFYSRKKPTGNDRLIKVIDQGNGRCVALPVFQDDDGEVRVAFHATTLKSLVSFLEENE